ncbi:MAG: DUF1549 domain-containing protein [Planctomycetes bacterium]|nr:DUF1549 domain-containing protein [Planctomycetota bacterium]
MIRHLLVAGLSAGLLWAAAQPTAAADEPKKVDPAPMGGISPQTQKINELIAKGWESAGIRRPAEKANDHEFMRRVFLDLQGRIPTVEEIRDFEVDRGPNKRVRLVHRLLYEKYTPKSPSGKPYTEIPGLKKVPIDYSAQYANNFAELWGVWLLSRSGVDDVYREQFLMWLEENLDKNTSYREFVTALITATGKSNENGAVHFVFRHLGDPLRAEDKGAKVDFERDGKFDNVPITSRVTRMFLGIQTQCTQCHDHPQAKEWKQRDFWGVNAFFRQTDKRGQQTAMGKKGAAGVGNAVELTDVPGWNRETSVFYDQRDGQRKAVFATMLKDVAQAEADQRSTKTLATVSGASGKTRRQILADWVTQHDNFEKAYVNRMWGHLFGRGLHKEPTVDDFKSDNEIVHPELLAYLAEQFKLYNYDSKRLLEWICTSDVYQLSHVAGKEKVKVGDKLKALTEVEFEPYFARMPLKAQSPEVLFESLAIATRARARMTDEAYKNLKRTWSARLVRNFGDDEGNEANFNGTIVQALLMMNGKDLNDQIRSDKKGGVVTDVIAKKSSPAAVYGELFLMTVSRHPTQAELARLEEIRAGKGRINLGGGTGSKGPGTPVPGAAPNDISFFEDVFWALLNTNEFMLNH